MTNYTDKADPQNPSSEPSSDDAPRTVRSTVPSRPALLSIRWLVVTAVVVSTGLAIVAIGLSGERQISRALTAEVEERLSLLALDLASAGSQALLGEYPELTLYPLINTITDRDPELKTVVVVDHENRIRGHLDPRRVGTPLEPSLLQIVSGDTARKTLVHDRDGFLLASAPIVNGGEERLGSVLVGLRADYVESRVRSARARQFLLVGLVLVVCVTAVAGLASFLLRPITKIRAGLERIAGGDLVTPLELRHPTELGMLAQTIDVMRESLLEAQHESVTRERLARELELARELQGSLIPVDPLFRGEFQIVGAHRPAYEVGGDYYDAFHLADGGVGIVVADVSGKGLRGCMVTTMVSSLVRSVKDQFQSPGELLTWLDAALSQSLPHQMFVTMCYGMLDADHNRFVFSCAGHSPTLVRRADGTIESFPGRGVPLGISKRKATPPRYEDQAIDLEPGDKLVLYTDGVTEAMHHTRPEQFGMERFEEVLRTEGEKRASDWIERQFTMLDSWSGDHRRFDDETLVVVERNSSALEVEIESPSIGPRLVSLAQLRGMHLSLPCQLKELAPLAEWVKGLPELTELSDPPALLATAIYEVCANVAEHGARDSRSIIDLWWVPKLDPAEWLLLPDELAAPFFVVRDRGRSFSPLVKQRTDFSSRATRRRGRGFGLDLVNRAMRHIVYLNDTPEGNLTVMMPAKEGALDRIAS